MNLEQAKLLARMAENIKSVPVCSSTDGIKSIAFMRAGEPVCLVCESVRAGIITIPQNEEIILSAKYGIDHPEGFSKFFGCTMNEATIAIFHSHLKRGKSYGCGDTSGTNYFTAIKELLTKYDYAHLLEPEEVIPIHETKQIIPAYKDQFTPALPGFDWKNPVRDIA
jgi:hypothetical protein